MRIYKRGKSQKYWVDFRFKGRRIREPSPYITRELAKAYGLKRQIEESKKDLNPEAHIERIRFNEMADRYLKSWGYKLLSKASVIGVITRLKKHFGKCFIGDLTTESFGKYISEREKDQTNKKACNPCRRKRVEACCHPKLVEKATVNREMETLRHILNKALEWRLLARIPGKVPMLKLDNRLTDFLQRNEEKRLLEACDDQIKPIVICGIYTGARRKEMFDLKWESVDFNNNTIEFLITKSGKRRKIPMHPELRKVLQSLPKISEFVFNIYNHRNLIYQAFREAGIKTPQKWHLLRHTYGTRLGEKGVDDATLMELMGHSTPAMTKRYTHTDEKRKAAAIHLLDPLPKEDQKSGAQIRAQVVLKEPKKLPPLIRQKGLILNNLEGDSPGWIRTNNLPVNSQLDEYQVEVTQIPYFESVPSDKIEK